MSRPRTYRVTTSEHATDRTVTTPEIRSTSMLLMYEALARARMSEMQDEAEEARRALRLVAARRWQRRAKDASRRARQAQAAVW